MAEKILIGADVNNPLYSFENATILQCSCVLSSAMVGDELATDQFMPVVYSASYIRVAFVPAESTGLITADGQRFLVYPGTGFLDKLPYGTPIWYYSNDVLIGKFYSQRIVRSGKAYFDVLAVSALGILDGQRHQGGIYTGETFQTVAAEIIGEGFSFSCADDVASVRVYGWLPVGSRRENLHQLLFACGVNLVKGTDGDIHFRFPDVDTVTHVPDSRIFLGGNVDYMSPATRVEVTEHIFEALSTDETAVLYDNTQGGEVAVNDYVVFQKAPVHDLAATGSLVIHESGVNYAVVSGTGTLTGQVYTHITRVLSKETGADSENHTVSVTEATLVNVANSENVAQRLVSYYSSVRTITADIKLSGERPGDQISFNNTYEEPERAFLASMELRASGSIRASCELVTGYIPSGGGNNYTRVVVLTGTGSWTVPGDIPVNSDGVGKIRVAVVQAGGGGDGGGMGDPGEDTQVVYDRENLYPGTVAGRINLSTSKNPGAGGKPGAAGKAGKVLVFALEVNPGDVFYYLSGSGGIGGSGQTSGTEAQPGTEGGETTFGSYSSANGSIVDGGYLDIINNVLYAGAGEQGTSGGTGRIGALTPTDKGGGPLGGDPSTGRWASWISGDCYAVEWQCGGGAQGGDAYGVQGGAGETQADTFEEDYANRVNSPHLRYGSYGGDGATPKTPATPKSIGTGGGGGHGGGGGGTGGTFTSTVESIVTLTGYVCKAGKGGNGGRGGNGAPGGVIIYL